VGKSFVAVDNNIPIAGKEINFEIEKADIHKRLNKC